MKRIWGILVTPALALLLSAGTAGASSLDRSGTQGGDVNMTGEVKGHVFTTVAHAFKFAGLTTYNGGNNVWETGAQWDVATGVAKEATKVTIYQGGPGQEKTWALMASCDRDPWLYPDEVSCNLTGYAGTDPCEILGDLGVDCHEYYQIPMTAQIINLVMPEGTIDAYRVEAANAPPPAPAPPPPCSPLDDVIIDEPIQHQYVLADSGQFKVVVYKPCLVTPEWKYEKQSFEVDFEWFDPAAANGEGAWMPQTGLLASMPMVKNPDQALTFGTKSITLPQKGKWRMHARSQWWWDNPPGLKPGGWSDWREFSIGRPKFSRAIMAKAFKQLAPGEPKHGPDLTIDKYEVIVVNPGDDTTEGVMTYKGLFFTWTVMNIGDAISGPTQIQVTCSASPTGLPCPAELNRTWEIPQLWPNPDRVPMASGGQVVWNSPAAPVPSPETRWTVRAKVDPQQLIAETGEYNNSHVDTYSPRIFVKRGTLQAFVKAASAGPQARVISPQGAQSPTREKVKPAVALTPAAKVAVPVAKAPAVAAVTTAALLKPDVRVVSLKVLPSQPRAGRTVDLVVRLKNEGTARSSAEQKYAVACKVVDGGPACAVKMGEFAAGKVLAPNEAFDLTLKGVALAAVGGYEVSATPPDAALKPLPFTVKPTFVKLLPGAVKKKAAGPGGTNLPAIPNQSAPVIK